MLTSIPLAPSLISALVFAGPTGQVERARPTDAVPIVGGSEATACQWPAVVSILEDDDTPVMCSGSLVAPGVVMTAAHCVNPDRPVVAVGFGEHGQATGEPERVVAVTDCVGNPDYYEGQGADVGYCLLAAPVTDVPIVPLLSGCEVDILAPGTEITIVGYGATSGVYDDFGNLVTEGVGPKRWTTQTVDYIDDVFEEITMFDTSGSQSACFGDSGGPALIQLEDGTWRVFGTGGHLYDPGGIPGPIEPGNVCGIGAAYGFAPYVIGWLEAGSGVDLTPCWDGDQWAPEAGCAEFPLDPNVGAGGWASGCAGGSFGGGAPPVCVEGPSGTGDTGTGSTGGPTDTGPGDTTDAGSSDEGTSDTLTTGPAEGGTGPGSTSTGASDDEGSTGAPVAADGGGDGGCGCRNGTPAGAAWGVLILPGIARRRRRQSWPRPRRTR